MHTLYTATTAAINKTKNRTERSSAYLYRIVISHGVGGGGGDATNDSSRRYTERSSCPCRYPQIMQVLREDSNQYTVTRTVFKGRNYFCKT